MRHASTLILTLLAASFLPACSRSRSDPYASETAEREALVKKLLDEGDAGRARNVASTAEIQFEEGFSILSYDPAEDFHNHAFRWMGQNAHVRLKTHGNKPMKLVVAGWIHEKMIRSKAVISVFIDGQFMGTTGAIQDGHYRLESIIPEWALTRPWVDLSIRTSAVAFHWGDPPTLNVVVLYNFGWTEAQ